VRLEQENASDDLQAVVDAMPHLLEQEVLLAKEFVLLALRRLEVGYVLHGEQ